MMLEVCDLDRPTSAPASACVSPRPPSRSAIVGGYAIGRDGDGTFSRFLGGAFSLLGVVRVGSWTSSKRLSRYLIGSTGSITGCGTIFDRRARLRIRAKRRGQYIHDFRAARGLAPRQGHR